MVWMWLRGLLSRRAGESVVTAVGVAIAVALLASLGTFLATAQLSMTGRAASGVAVDWQVQVAPTADPVAVADQVKAAPGVKIVRPVGFAQSSGLRATSGSSTQSTGPGVVLGIPDDYASTFPGTLRFLAGAHQGALIAQQTAANLHVAPGDALQIQFDGSQPVQVTVSGIVDLPQANSLFQIVGAPPQSQPVAPPDNVVLLSDAQFAEVRRILSHSRPDLISRQIHVVRSHALPPDPATSFIAETAAAHNLEVKLAGAGRIGDNLGAALDAAREDASYATVLFLFLGLPGAVLCGALTIAFAGVNDDRRRRDQALVRVRGGSARLIGLLAGAEALVAGVAGGMLGLLISAVIGSTVLPSTASAQTLGTQTEWRVGALLAGILIAVGAVLIPAVRQFRAVEVTKALAQAPPARRPWWIRVYLDVMVLALSAVVVSVTTQGGYSLVLAPEGVPAIQVNYWAFLGPGLFWIGAGLMIWRLVDMVLRRARPTLSLLARPVARNLADVATATLSRRRAVLSRATVLLGLALAFAASTSIFNATYQQQAEVDAQLTNGADVAVHEPPGSTVGPELATGVARTPGVIAVEPLQHRFAYVGADLQDLYGVRAGTISQATTLEDAYFQNGTAAQLLHRLENQADAVLVSAETVADFQLQPGDVLNLRLPSSGGGSLVTVPFHYAGVVNEFPTAPKDSFLVANANYVAEQTGDSAVASFLVDTDPGIAETVADALRQRLGPTATVTTAKATRALIGSSLTSVDLQGLTRIELAFAVVLAAAAGALVFILGLHERKRSAAIASVLGGTPRQLRDLALVEAFFVIIGGLLTGSVAGALLTWMLIAVLTGVFDPPPAALAVPWEYLASVVLIAAAAIGVAALASTRFGRHKPTIEYLRDL